METCASSSSVSSETSSSRIHASSSTSAKPAPCVINLVASSQQKLLVVAKSLSRWVYTSVDGRNDDNRDTGTILHKQPCKTVDDAVGYRCRCAFQIVWSEDGKAHYAVRENQVPVITDIFPVANKRIQKAMEGFLKIINVDCGQRSPEETTSNRRTTPQWRKTCLLSHLTSISFSSSWSDDEFSDCFITLHYNTSIEDIAAWKIEAKNVCIELNLRQLSGRSRKKVTLALDDERNLFIRDTLWIWPNRGQKSAWNVDLNKPTSEMLSNRTCFVYYEKLEGAFFHPNARAMCRALEWMLSRLSVITHDGTDRKRMLEMFCGCGAHTVAISKTGILEKIVAVEYDARLVQACHRNVVLNQSQTVDDVDSRTTPIDIVLADASVWAHDKHQNNFDILLVDPPRQGLQESVCQMAIDGLFQHILYISCGHDALARDLAFLSRDYVVENCTLLDLFPQTTSVETLVHLVRMGH